MAVNTPQAACPIHIAFPGEADANQLGGKAAALQAMHEDFPVPDWCAVISAADLDVGQVQLPDLGPALQRLDGGRGPYAVRSSAREEDGRAHSFAGQLESWLDVPPEEIAEHIRQVWASAASDRVRAYRRERGLSEDSDLPTVVIQRMVRPQWSGVAFSADPVSGQRGVRVVAAVEGQGEALVAGETSGETLRLDRDLQVLDGDRDQARQFPVELGQQAAVLAARAEAHFQRPQDIEWVWDGERLWLLQSRPITTLANQADPDGEPVLWDNSNIAESYSGITTPMTFSFARHVYAGVYRQFCRIMRVPERVIADNEQVFDHLLGLIRGRIYYNLLNWYRCLAMLPGFTFNRPLMEQMMGVDQALPQELMPRVVPPRPQFSARMRDLLRLSRSLLALLVSLRQLPRNIRYFHERLEDALASPERPLRAMRPDELVAHYRDLEARLLSRWDAPLVNDFFAMIFHGVLGKLCARWVGDAELHNTLLVAESGMISTEPARDVARLARQAASDPALVSLLRAGDAAAIRAGLRAHPALHAGIENYLQRFGDRCVEELKLESRTLNEDPLPLFRAIGARAAQGEGTGGPMNADAIRSRAEADMHQALKGHPLRRCLFAYVLRQARERVRDRENLRFERTRLFGRVRQILHELGKRLHAMEELQHPDDVFYLEIHEVLGFVQGRATTIDLAGLVRVRRAEFAAHEKAPAPANRFLTRGPVHSGHDYRNQTTVTPPDDGSDLNGTACCAGVVRGRARVVTDPRGASLEPGDILVAERTDPGWILLLSAASGVIVEHGSLLSHAAIVTRELGVPCVVAVPNATQAIKDGERLELDGDHGSIRRLDTGTAPAPAP